MPILDFSIGVAAGFAARLFAQLGASVRRMHTENPPLPREMLTLPAGRREQLVRYLNEGKSIEPAPGNGSAEALIQVVGGAVVIHDRGPGFAEALLASESLREALIVSISPYGWTGPYANWKSDSLLIQSVSGITNLIGSAEREPLMLPGFQIQYAAGTVAFVAAMAARLGGCRSGRHVHVTEFETASTMHQTSYHVYTRLGWVRKRGQFGLPSATSFECRDGTLIVCAANTRQWEALAIACDKPELLLDSRYSTFLERRIDERAINVELAPWFVSRSTEESFRILGEAGVAVGAVQAAEEVPSNPQLRHRGYFDEILGRERQLPVPFLINGIRPMPEVSE